MDINLNNALCLVQKQNLTETVVTNVCTGAITKVPHGTFDLFLGGFVMMFFFIIVGIIVIGVKEFRSY